jgi:sugar transferase (PEP-CTERM system associated)
MITVFGLRITWRLAALVAADSLIVLSTLLGATYLFGYPVEISAFFPRAVLVAAVAMVSLYYAHLYDFRVVADPRELLGRLIQALGGASLALAAVYFLFPRLVLGPGIAVLSLVCLVMMMLGWRGAVAWVAPRLRDRESLLLIGTGPATVSLARELHDRKELGVHIAGFIDPNPSHAGSRFEHPGIIGTLEDVPAIVKANHVNRVVVSLAEARSTLPMEKLLEMRLDGVTFDHLASVYEEYTGKIALENLRPSWLVFAPGFEKNHIRLAAKRGMDVACGCLGLLLASPLLILVALAVRLTSAGPVVYRQRRVGQHGLEFTLYKFRSMRADAEAASGPVWADELDDRVTPIGRFLRQSRLDELPQLWNVVTGDMSLVGPRPERPEFVKDLAGQIPFYGQRHVVKPGLTGWAQVCYRYGGSVDDTKEKLQLDLFYIKHPSIAFDVFIAVKTLQTLALRLGT